MHRCALKLPLNVRMKGFSSELLRPCPWWVSGKDCVPQGLYLQKLMHWTKKRVCCYFMWGKPQTVTVEQLEIWTGSFGKLRICRRQDDEQLCVCI